jgi:hypothetical protein
LYRGSQPAEGNWFQQIIECIYFKRAQGKAIKGSNENDPEVSVRMFKEFEAGLSGHLNVKKYDVRLKPFRSLQRFGNAIRLRDDLKLRKTGKLSTQLVPGQTLIVHY